MIQARFMLSAAGGWPRPRRPRPTACRALGPCGSARPRRSNRPPGMRDDVPRRAMARRGPGRSRGRRLPLAVGRARTRDRRASRRRARCRHAQRPHRGRPRRAHGRAGEPARAEPGHPTIDDLDEEEITPAHTLLPRSPTATSATRSRCGATRWRPTGRGPSPTPTAPRSGAASVSPRRHAARALVRGLGRTPTTSAGHWPPTAPPEPSPDVDVRPRAAILPLALAVPREHDGKTAWPAPAGGDWLVPMGAGDAAADPDVTVTADVLDCRRSPAPWTPDRRRRVDGAGLGRATSWRRARTALRSRALPPSRDPVVVELAAGPRSKSPVTPSVDRRRRRSGQLGFDRVELGDDAARSRPRGRRPRPWCPTSARRRRRRALP